MNKNFGSDHPVSSRVSGFGQGPGASVNWSECRKVLTDGHWVRDRVGQDGTPPTMDSIPTPQLAPEMPWVHTMTHMGCPRRFPDSCAFVRFVGPPGFAGNSVLLTQEHRAGASPRITRIARISGINYKFRMEVDLHPVVEAATALSQIRVHSCDSWALSLIAITSPP